MTSSNIFLKFYCSYCAENKHERGGGGEGRKREASEEAIVIILQLENRSEDQVRMEMISGWDLDIFWR